MLKIKLFDQTFFLEGSKSRIRYVGFDFLAVNNECALVDVRFEDLASLSLGERNVMAVHFSFTGNFTDCHCYFSFTVLTIALKASGLWTARSARTLRSTLIFLAFIPAISWE